MSKYDVVVIGSGVGGATIAHALKDGGKRVALIEENLWGGTCPNRGCDPKKIFISGVEAMERINQLAGKGFQPVGHFDWKELLAFKRIYTAPFPEKFKKKAADRGIDIITGSARFVNKNRIQVGNSTIEADLFVIATGQRPDFPNIKGRELLKTSTDFLEMDELPEKIIFLGAGYIAFELGAIARAAGSEVTIVHRNNRPLKAFDEDLVRELIKQFQKKGIRFVLDTEITEVRKKDEAGRELEVIGDSFSDTCNYVVSAVGRIPNVEKLDLKVAGVNFDEHGIGVNEFLQTSNPLIYACGDVIAKRIPKLTPVAEFEGRYLAGHILSGSDTPIKYPPIVSVVYGSPKLASVGVSTAEAKEKPGRYEIKEMDITSWFSNFRINEPVAKVKLVYEDGLLVGASALGGHADELINYLLFVIEKKIDHDELNRMVFGSPTVGSEIGDLV